MLFAASCSTPACSEGGGHPALYGGTYSDELGGAAGAEASEHLAVLDVGDASDLDAVVVAPACALGQRRACLEYRGDAANGYLFCERGLQACDDAGRWQACVVGEVDVGASVGE